jgi:hypothetical protein
MSGTKPLTQRERELLTMPSIASQMPVEFKNGASWVEFVGECKFCNDDIPAALVRGCVSRPLEAVVVVEAIGVCPACRIATPFLYRLHDDMRLTGPREDGWKTWGAEPTLLDHAARFFRQLGFHRGE